mgnify:CR=1 FL=1
MTRRRGLSRQVILSLMIAATTVLGATGCNGLGLGTARPVTWYALNDQLHPSAAAAQAVHSRRIRRVLMIGPVDANPFYDSTQVAYSRSDIARAYYQFAAWTERPAKRLSLLVERRLAARGRFLGVVNSTAGVRGDLLLTLSLDEIFHNAAKRPQHAQISVHARLIDWRNRTLIAERGFSSNAKVTAPNAASAVRGLTTATTSFLDELAIWVETKGRGPVAVVPSSKNRPRTQ